MTRLEELEFIARDSGGYSDDQFTDYISEAGWQDWMNAYTTDDTKEHEYVTDREMAEICTIQLEGFKLSHLGCSLYINDIIG